MYEWCHDGPRDYKEEAVEDPVEPTDAGARRVVRGGSWLGPARDVRAAGRVGDRPGVRGDGLGVRVSSHSGSQGRRRGRWMTSS